MTNTRLEIAQRAIRQNGVPELFSKEHARSVYNLVPPNVRAGIDKIKPEYFVLADKQLFKILKPCPTTQILRITFWTEYQRAQFNSCKMNMGFVYADVMEENSFNLRVVEDPDRLAWIMRPPIKWEAGMRAILNQGIQVMLEAVHSANIVDDDGNVNPKNLNAILKVVEMATIQVHGLPTLRTETKSMNVNINQSTPPPNLDRSKVPELERELAQLEAKDVVEVTNDTKEKDS